MCTVEKGEFTIKIEKTSNGISIAVKKDKDRAKKYYAMSSSRDMYILDSKKWKSLDTSSVKINRKTKDNIDEASYKFSHSISILSSIRFFVHEFLFLESLFYDLLCEKDINWWIPGNGDASRIIMKDGEFEIIYDDNDIETMKIKDGHWNTFDECSLVRNDLIVPLKKVDISPRSKITLTVTNKNK